MSDFDYGKTLPSGQHERYPSSVHLGEDGMPAYKQPVRNTYRHRVCGAVTTMRGDDLCLTYATNPHFYGATFCCLCRTHLPLSEFEWEPDGVPMNKVFGNPGQDLRLPLRRFPGHYKVWGERDEERTAPASAEAGD